MCGYCSANCKALKACKPAARNLQRSSNLSTYVHRAGLLSCCNILLLSFALKFGDASTMIPIANTSFVFTLGLSLVTGMEKLDRCALCTCLVLWL